MLARALWLAVDREIGIAGQVVLRIRLVEQVNAGIETAVTLFASPAIPLHRSTLRTSA
jgi:hypothetical protein